MTTSLIREADGNVVLRSDTTALRFFWQFGGTPLEWYQEPFDMLTNPHPGSAASVAWNTGQDPTQASVNGLLPNPIARLGDNASQKYRFYMREVLFDPAGRYIVTGTPPDFWLSAEAVDDAICPTRNVSDHGWRTKYHPGNFAAGLNVFECPVIFEGSTKNGSGIFLVGNELKGGDWNNRIREYKKGRVAFKTFVTLGNAGSDAVAGILIRKNIPTNVHNATKDDAWFAPGYRFLVNKKGGWDFWKDGGFGSNRLRTGTLTKAQVTKLTGAVPGLEFEIRSSKDCSTGMELWIDGLFTSEFVDPTPVLGQHLGVYASCMAGFIPFSHRQPFDLNTDFVADYRAEEGGRIISEVCINSTSGESIGFYRANPPAIFLNKNTFKSGDRACLAFHEDGDSVPMRAMPFMKDYKKYWCGNVAGTAGVLCTPLIYEVDGITNPGAHILLDDNGVNDEFVMMLNPLSPNTITKAKNIRMKALWQTHI